jgi:uncharacterized membrane protein
MSDKPTAVRVYLARVRTALADLPAGEIEEILDDVRPHLAELEAELGAGARVEALIERLGTPESYAAELRASGGYPPASEAGAAGSAKRARSLLGSRIALWGLVLCAAGAGVFAFMAAATLSPDPLLGLLVLLPAFAASLVLLLRNGIEPVLALPEMSWLSKSLACAREQQDTQKAMRFLGSLKPAWWVACALALVVFGLLLMARELQAVLLLPFLIAAGVAAVWAGQRVRTDRRLLWLVMPVSTFVVGGVLGGFGATVDLIGSRTPYQTATSYYTTSDQYGNQLLNYGGKELENVYAFDAEGKPLTEIYLYDHEGRPIKLTRFGCDTQYGGRTKIGEDNRFPRPQLDQATEPITDRGGRNNGYQTVCRENAGVPFNVAVPKGKATVSAPAPSSSLAPSSPVPTTAPASPTSTASPTPTK